MSETSNQEEWSVLAKQAQAGDKKAYHRLLSEISLFIPKYLSGKLASQDWIEDIVQEVLISVHKSLHTYSPDMKFRPWLISIVHYRKTDFLRKHYAARDNMKVSDENLEFDKNFVTFSPHSGELKDIEAALGQLPAKQRDVFRLVKVEGYTIKEVAEKMDMSESAVKVTAHRGTVKLASLLGNKK